VALYIAVVGLLSVVAQTVVLTFFMKAFNAKATIILGLIAQTIQLLLYGFSSDTSTMWTASVLAAFSSITYPAISSYVSMYADPDKQGLVQGMITGVRGLCNGLGPTLYGMTFSLFHVDIIGNSKNIVNPVAGGISTDLLNRLGKKVTVGPTLAMASNVTSLLPTASTISAISERLMPGPPFAFGALLVMAAILVTMMIPELIQYHSKTSDIINGIFGKNPKKSDSSYYYNQVDQTMTGGGQGSKGDLSINKTSDSDTDKNNVLESRPVGLASVVTSNRKRGQSMTTCELQMPLMADMDPL
jgi:hypothetical protein